MSYTKLAHNILDSTIWRCDDHVLRAWLVVLVCTDWKTGIFEMPIPAWADRAKITITQCEEAIAIFESSDPYSRSQEAEGRRMLRFGSAPRWRVVNWERYARERQEDHRRDYMREYMRQRRAEERKSQSSAETVSNVSQCKPMKTKTKTKTLLRTGTALKDGSLSDIGKENTARASRARGRSNLKPPPRTQKKFIPPTVEEVRDHLQEKDYHFDPESFVAFYESKGWKVGDQKMKSWKAACTTWEKRWKENHPEAGEPDYAAMGQPALGRFH